MSLKSSINSLIWRSYRRTEAFNVVHLNRSALLNNFDLFHRISGLDVIPVLKANAYGHGLAEIVTILRDRNPPLVAVNEYFEALAVHNTNPSQVVLVLGQTDVRNITHINTRRTVYSVQDMATVEAFARSGRKFSLSIEVNTGMNRYGVSPDDIDGLIDAIQNHKNLSLVSLMSHLADSDGDDVRSVANATKVFDGVVSKVLDMGIEPKYIHIAQSAGSVRAKSKYANAARIGIGLYGINPFTANSKWHKQLQGLRPVLKLTSVITKVTDLQKGDKVSYNYTFSAPKAMQIGVLPMGYYEGVDRSLSNQGSVSVGGQSASIVGRVCMNHTIINLDKTHAKVGDEVTVISDDTGSESSVESRQTKYGLFSYTQLTSIAPTIRRVIDD